MSTSRKPLLCLDFDGVLSSYASGWLGADRCPDDPVPGAMDAVAAYAAWFRVAVYSSRTGQPGGLYAMQQWLRQHLVREHGADEGARVYDLVEWPHAKPSAFVTLDDRALQFSGVWPKAADLATFQPWNKGEPKRGFAFLGETETDVQGVTPAHDWWAVTATTKGWVIVGDRPMQLCSQESRVGYGATLYHAMEEATRMSVTAVSARLRRGPWRFEEPTEYVSPFGPGPLAKKEHADG